MRKALATLALCLAAIAAHAFDLRRDTFPFANETAWTYSVDEANQLQIGKRTTPARYAKRCFVLTRAVLQFDKFARFDPRRAKVSRDEYRRLIRAISRIPVWSSGPRERIVIPGFRDLRSFAISHEGLLKENLGNWLPTYFRPGNYRMAMGHPRAGQERVAHWLASSLEAGHIRGIYLSRFPHMNHAVVAFRAKREPGGSIRFTAYDPNTPGEPCEFRYDAARRSFDFEKRSYFPGGQVNAMRIYLSPLH